MKFSTVSTLLACPLLGATYESQLKHATYREDNLPEYQTDLFKGTNLKQEESSLNNSDLTYTTRNGKK
ncbi:hypothetical protein KC318_g19191, partial [Hortaea werneckii]